MNFSPVMFFMDPNAKGDVFCGAFMAWGPSGLPRIYALGCHMPDKTDDAWYRSARSYLSVAADNTMQLLINPDDKRPFKDTNPFPAALFMETPWGYPVCLGYGPGERPPWVQP